MRFHTHPVFVIYIMQMINKKIMYRYYIHHIYIDRNLHIYIYIWLLRSAWTSSGLSQITNNQLQGRGAKTTTAAKMQKLCTKGKGDVAPMAKDPQVVNVVTILGAELKIDGWSPVPLSKNTMGVFQAKQVSKIGGNDGKYTNDCRVFLWRWMFFCSNILWNV